MNIVTNHDYPPIPDRRFYWSAVDGETFDGTGAVGRGATEADAIADLIGQLAEAMGYAT